MKSIATIMLACVFSPPALLQAQLTGTPQILSILPIGGQKGTSFEVRVRGQNLEGTYAAWLDCPAIQAEVKKVEVIEPEKKADGSPQKEQKAYQVFLKLAVAETATIGAHSLRLVSASGVSGPLVLLVSGEPAVSETEKQHSTPEEVQLVPLGSVLNGNISKKGEVDYYSFNVTAGQQLSFEVITGSGVLSAAPGILREPELILYESAGGSWFDPGRLARLKPEDESFSFYFPKSSYTAHYRPRLLYHFRKGGRYLARVRTSDGQGGPDHAYQLRIMALNDPTASAQKRWLSRGLAHGESPIVWRERDFARRLSPSRLLDLEYRTIRSPEAAKKVRSDGLEQSGSKEITSTSDRIPNAAPQSASSVVPSRMLVESEKEPNGGLDQASEVDTPTLIQGVIQEPGDEDHFKFEAKTGERLAFEIETPDLLPPYFTPRLEVMDTAGRVVFSNIYRKVSGDGDDWVKTIEPKTVYTFEHGGVYFLQLRDLTSRYGDARFVYRVLIRPQLPHIGEIAPKTFGQVGTEREEDRVNLGLGESKKLLVVSEREEGFAGEIELGFDGLPPGVRASAVSGTLPEIQSQGGQVYEMRGAIHKERYRPQRIVTSIVLIADPDAPITPMPQLIRLTARPISEETLGTALPVYEMPLMVVRPKMASPTVKTVEAK